MSLLGLVLLIVLALILLGGFTGPWGLPYGYGGGHYAVGGIGLVLAILLILILMGRV